MSETELANLKTLHGRLIRALENGDLHLSFKIPVLAAPSSPVSSAADLGLVAVIGLVLFLVPSYVKTVQWDLTALAGFVLAMVLWLRWYTRKLRIRAVKLACESVDGWQALWRRGGLGLATGDGTNTNCQSPLGDWGAFVRRHVLNQL